MKNPLHKAILVPLFACLGLFAWHTIRAQFRLANVAPGSKAVHSHLSESQARIWLRLLQPLPNPHPRATTLLELVNLVKTSTTDDQFPRGIPIYVNSFRLQPQNFEYPLHVLPTSASLAQALTTGLKSVSLRFQVRPEGYVAIFDEQSPGPLAPDLLNEARALRLDIRALRHQIVGNSP